MFNFLQTQTLPIMILNLDILSIFESYLFLNSGFLETDFLEQREH